MSKKKKNVLLTLHKGYGLGDAVQMSAVLRHVAKRRPEWVIDYQAEPGRHGVGRGIVANTFAHGTPYPSPHYDAEVLMCLYDTWDGHPDRPNTRVTSCLQNCFCLPWEAACARYSVDVSDEAILMIRGSLGHVVPLRTPKRATPTNRLVAVHYRGDSAKVNKDLSHAQAALICKWVEKLGATPILVDWRDVSPLTDTYHILTTGRLPHSRVWGADAEMNCALIQQCAAFVGIDSGPAKCASATDVPSLVVWTGHHPAPFHDPAPNTTHLVPRGYHTLAPVSGDPGVIEWFEANYRTREYEGDPVAEAALWLKEVLK